jgi:hypothetical protein
MRYAIIENGLVTNVVVADAQIAAEKGWVQCDYGGPGWTYADGIFTEPVRVEPPAPPKPTKEQLMAELAALTAKIQALE